MTASKSVTFYCRGN